jgi:hypothetical protein
MKKSYWLKAVGVFAAGALLFAGSASAQAKFDRKTLLKKFLEASNKIPARQKKLLSSGMQNFLALATEMTSPHVKSGIGDDGGTFNGLLRVPAAHNAIRASAAFAASPVGPGGTIRISNPNLDFVNSVVSGFTQSETSTAWCGNTIVAGYNDSGAILRTLGVNPLGAGSLSGVSVSANGGKSFIDLGFLNPGSDPANILLGDPVVACTSPFQFYYSSIFATATPPDVNGNRNPITAVGVNSSGVGGISWAAPVSAVAKDGFLHSIDKPWIAADPTNALRLFVSYTDFDFSGTSAACPNDFRIAIELVNSVDGGNTWSSPAVIDQECGASFNSVSGSNIAVAADGKVYVAFEFIPGLTPDNEIHVARSLDSGNTFGTPVVVSSTVVPNGDGGALQGGFRNNEFPQIAVDRTNKSSRGTIYIVWSDGSDNVVPDIGTFTGTYAYPDIFISKSTDGGQTFTVPSAVSPTLADFTGIGRDQFFPGVAVDKDGEVGVCYYDRRSEPGNTVIDRFCSTSHNHGASWNEERISHSNWLPLHASDNVINPAYIGDYDALTSDFLLQNDGFYGAFEIQLNGNPDVFGKKF